MQHRSPQTFQFPVKCTNSSHGITTQSGSASTHFGAQAACIDFVGVPENVDAALRKTSKQRPGRDRKG